MNKDVQHNYFTFLLLRPLFQLRLKHENCGVILKWLNTYSLNEWSQYLGIRISRTVIVCTMESIY